MIEPALTAKEWEAHLSARDLEWDDYNKALGRDESDDGVPMLDGGDLFITYDAATVAQNISKRDRHAVAALALHGQPFGFKPEDVAFARRLAVAFERNDAMDWDEVEAFLKSIAERIAALLPPEDNTT